MKSKILGLLAVGLLAGPMAANAALVTYNWTLTASPFPAGAPQDPVTAVVSFDADPLLTNQSGTASSFSMVLGSTTFTTASFFAGNVLSIGNNCDAVGCILLSDLNFLITVDRWRTSPTVVSFAYVSAGQTWRATTGSVADTAVPEPGTLALLGLGLLGLGMTRRKAA